MKEQIIEIIKKITGYNDVENIDLIEEDIIDSLAFIELIAELEKEFNVEIQPTQVPGNYWRSVDKIVELIEKLKS